MTLKDANRAVELVHQLGVHLTEPADNRPWQELLDMLEGEVKKAEQKPKDFAELTELLESLR